MSSFVFRNNTVERFFGKDYSFSGYDDISVIPKEVDSYIWWYQMPIKYDRRKLALEIASYAQKFSLVVNSIDSNKSIIALTMIETRMSALVENERSVKDAITSYNMSLYASAKEHQNVKVLNFSDFCSRYSAEELIDWKFYFLSQMTLNPKLHKDFKEWFDRKMSGIASIRKKCLVLDLDNTLWGGVLGEDGLDGIKIGGDYPGKAFLYWQEALLQLAESGIILAVCSKNNQQDVFDAWEKNPYLVLKKVNFAAYRINWTDKATNIEELAQELNIGLDSMVFVDDNPTERELIRQTLPMVSVPDFPEHPYELPNFYNTLVEQYFQIYVLTDEDKNKTKQYKANAERREAQAAFADYDKYLESLQMTLTLEKSDAFNIPRIAQMTQKTNQFNLTTHRYSESDIKERVDSGWKIWCIGVKDKFGDNGITGVIMLNEGIIDSLLLSCRVLGKGIEFAFMNTVLQLVKDSGCKRVTAEYLPTAKNAQVADFYEKCGFSCLQMSQDGRKSYSIDLNKADLNVKSYYNIIIK